MLEILTLTRAKMSEMNDGMERTGTAPKRDSYHHGDLRAQLIEATRQLVEAHGPDHFSVSKACRLAGVSTAAPYKHFKDKDEMLRAVALEGMQRQATQMMAELERCPQGSLDRIIALGRVYVRFAQDEPGVFRLMFGLSDDHDEDADMIAAGEACFGLVQREIAAFDGRASVSEADVGRAFMLWSFVHGLSFLAIDGKLQKMGDAPETEALLRSAAVRMMAQDLPGAPI